MNFNGKIESLFFFKLFIYFNWRLVTSVLWWVWHTLTWISHGCTCVPPSLNLTPISLPIPSLCCRRAPALSALLHASNLHWLSILHMVIYMFQCSSLILSHPWPLAHSPKVCSLHLCLFCCLAYRVYRLSKFHIYALIHCIGVFLSDLLHSV